MLGAEFIFPCYRTAVQEIRTTLELDLASCINVTTTVNCYGNWTLWFYIFLTFVGVLRAEAVELVEVCDAVGIRATAYHKESVILIVCCAILVVCVKTNGKVIRHSITQLFI